METTKKYIPRRLTKAEIDDILSGIERPTYCIKSATMLALDQIKNLLRKQLESIELVPEAIPEMKNTIRIQYNRSLVESQTGVGFLVAEALAQPITQMTLNSVVSETQIVICDQDTKQAKVVEIGVWIDELIQKNMEKVMKIPENRTEYLELDKPVLIPSTTCDGQTEWMELTAVTRHLPVGDLVKIKTRSGREVTATSQKSFLVYNEKEDKLKEKDGKDLKVGDLVGIHLAADKTPLITDLSLRQYLEPTRFIYGSEVKKFKDQYEKDKTGRQVPANWWKQHRNKTFTIALGRNDSIVKSVEQNDFEPGMVYPKISTQVKNKIPETMKLDRELGYIMGLYLAEGYANKTTLIFSNNAPEVLEPVEAWCKNMKVGYHIQVQKNKNFIGATSTDLRIHSTLLAELFIKMMGVGSPNKRIPSEALNGPEEFVVGILDGYITGDGCINKNDGSVCASSVSKELILGINFLLARLGIMAKMSGTQSKKNNIGSKVILYSHTLNVRNGFAKLFADKIRLTSKDKQAKLETVTRTKKYRHESGKYYKNWKNIMLDPIVEVSTISSKLNPEDPESKLKFVYDVTVPKSLNFNTYNTQILIDTFHSSGSSKNVSSGIDALKEIFNGSEERKSYNMNIHFNVCDLDYDDIFDLRSKIVEVSFESIISNFEYRPSSSPLPPWTESYLKITNQPFPLPEYSWSLRLTLDVDRMLAFRVSMPKILSMIKDKAPPNIIAVPSPISYGILDLYPKDDEIESSLGQNSTLLFLSVSVMGTIQQFRLSGIKGINGVFPTSTPIMSVIIEEILFDIEEERSTYFLKLSRSKMKTMGIGIKEMKKMFRLSKPRIDFESEIDDGIFVKMPKGVKDTPVKFITKLISNEEEELDNQEKEMRQKGIKGYIAKGSDFLKSSKCWYAETNGKNFLEVIKLPEVDPYHSYSNDFHEIASLLGIEAVRNLLIFEMKNVLGKDEYINYRHISLLSDVMCNLGKLTPISFYGAIRFGQGALSLATNQQSMKVFQNAAAFGKKENTNAVSSSVMLGKEPEGVFNILMDEKKAKKILETRPQPPVEQFEESIDKLLTDFTEENFEGKNQEYFDFMATKTTSKLYGNVNRKVVDLPEAPPQITIAPQKVISPPLAQISKKINDIPVFGEDITEIKTVNAPEKTKLTKSIVPRDETEEDIEEVQLVRKPKVPSKVPTVEEEEDFEGVQLVRKTKVPPKKVAPVAKEVAPAKKTVSDVKSRLAKVKEQKLKQKPKDEDVEDSIGNLKDL